MQILRGDGNLDIKMNRLLIPWQNLVERGKLGQYKKRTSSFYVLDMNQLTQSTITRYSINHGDFLRSSIIFSQIIRLCAKLPRTEIINGFSSWISSKGSSKIFRKDSNWSLLWTGDLEREMSSQYFSCFFFKWNPFLRLSFVT